jgi:hypothetical protein
VREVCIEYFEGSDPHFVDPKWSGTFQLADIDGRCVLRLFESRRLDLALEFGLTSSLQAATLLAYLEEERQRMKAATRVQTSISNEARSKNPPPQSDKPLAECASAIEIRLGAKRYKINIKV